MKHYKLYTLFCFAASAISVFLPFIQSDKYVYRRGSGPFGFFNTTREMVANDVVSSGLEMWPVFMPIISIFGLCFILSLRSNLATAILNLILGTLLIVILGGFYYLLSTSKNDVHFLIGFNISLFAAFIFLFLTIRNLRDVIQRRRKPVEKNPLDILDQSLEK